jgi:hypothetical protein
LFTGHVVFKFDLSNQRRQCKRRLQLLDRVDDDNIVLSKGVNYNKLKVNVEKTKFMVITNKRTVKNEVSLNIDDQPIERVTKMKYIEMMLDDPLKLDDNVDYICKKMGRKYGFMQAVKIHVF